MVNFPLSSRFSFTTSSAPSTPASSCISSRSRVNPRLPSCPAPKSPPTTALSILDDATNYPDASLISRPKKRSRTSGGCNHHDYTSLSDLLSIPLSVLDRETNESEREREARERDRAAGIEIVDTPWTAPPTPDLYFLPHSSFLHHHRTRSEPSPSPTGATTHESIEPTTRRSPTRPCFARTRTDPGYGTSPDDSNMSGASRRSSTGSPPRS
ncbi:hypothetical protein JCM3766R1_003811 [Sporobolomyces carnicolor]